MGPQGFQGLSRTHKVLVESGQVGEQGPQGIQGEKGLGKCRWNWCTR